MPAVNTDSATYQGAQDTDPFRIMKLFIRMHPVRPGELAADHPVPLVLGGEPLPARPGVLCASCNARKGLSQRRR